MASMMCTWCRGTGEPPAAVRCDHAGRHDDKTSCGECRARRRVCRHCSGFGVVNGDGTLLPRAERERDERARTHAERVRGVVRE